MALIKPNRGALAMVFMCYSLSMLLPFTEGDGKPSAYQVLQSYNLPIGLLPNGASGYTLDPGSGRFSVNLTSVCEFRVAKYKIKYSPPITGVISQNSLAEIDGVKVKIAFFWVGIANVNRNQDQLKFKVGHLVDKEFPISDFNSCPSCSQ